MKYNKDRGRDTYGQIEMLMLMMLLNCNVKDEEVDENKEKEMIEFVQHVLTKKEIIPETIITYVYGCGVVVPQVQQIFFFFFWLT